MEKQISFYDLTRSNYKIKNKIRLIELFAGIGSQAKALKNLGADFETWKVVEFDRYAIASYNAVHGTDFPTIDITEIDGNFLDIRDTDNYTYIMTYSFPCQDLSIAGHRRGMEKGTGTRSGLLWEVERLLNEVENLPQVLLMENVPMVHSKDNIGEFTEWVEFLRSKGYSNFWQDLNAKDYGVAQNRDRCFMVSILGEWNYNFPDPIPLTKCMKDYLEETVDEKFYINSPKAQKLIEMLLADGVEPNQAVDGTLGNPKAKEVASSIIARYDAGIQNKPKWGTMYFEKQDSVVLTGMASEEREPGMKPTDVAVTLCARDYKGLNNYGSNGVLQLVGQMDNSDGTHESQNRVYSPGGLAPTITTQSGGNLQPKTLECKAVGHIEHGTGRHQSNTVYSDSGLSPTLTTIENGGTQQIKVIGNYMPGEHEAGRVVDENGLCPTVKENHGTTTATVSGLRIRKLTPRETWRLMDFDDEDYDKAAKVNSQTQLYKQAGNSIVVGVLEAILGEML